MAKRGYKLQEFVAHSGNVNCLCIGRKKFRHFLTGGDDQKVNLWSIGKPTCLMSLSGHTSPVESVAFDSAEILVLAGSSSGSIKLWDLEESKMVRTLTGHRSYCTALEFHPFGEFFASGSMDTNLKIWDIRKKGCIHTYKGHTRGISAIRFSPDGRWVVSGGFDNVVKVWDLTAGKLLHDFKFHEGHVRSIEFHPLELLLATGSADRTVKFWDMETFEMIGSTRREAAGVRSVAFHPDGRTLFCGLDDSLKVYSWEPVISHDSVDMGWSTLGDLCIHDGKLLGGAYYENFVGVWVADVSLIEPYGGGAVAERNSPSEKKVELQENPLERAGSHKRSNSSLRSSLPDSDSTEIKNIYVDTAGGNCVTSRKAGSISSPKITVPSESKELSNLASQKQSSSLGLRTKTSGTDSNRSFTVPSIVPRDIPDGKESIGSRRECISSGKAGSDMPLKPPHMRKPSNSKFDMEKLSTTLEFMSVDNVKTPADTKKDLDFNSRLDADNNAKGSTEDKHSDIKIVVEKVEKTSPVALSSDQENGNKTLDCSKGVNTIKVVNGVAVVRGRTRSLVERFEMRERFNGDEVYAPDTINHAATQASKRLPLDAPDTTNHAVSQAPTASPLHTRNTTTHAVAEAPQKTALDIRDSTTHAVTQAPKTSTLQNNNQQIVEREESGTNDCSVIDNLMQSHDVLLSTFRSRLTKLQVVRHFWERNDVKGAINATRKLPDHSVQADVVSALVERMGIITLDLLSCLLPVLLGLLDSKVERHAVLSLEMLLKLVAVFGPVVSSTVSAPPAVGVDLHAEQRLECCKECFVHLQNIQKLLPSLMRRGGLFAKSALELNLVLQAS